MQNNSVKGLSPHGESGLKLSMLRLMSATRASLPARGEWIEIKKNWSLGNEKKGLSPHGESGLKLPRVSDATYCGESLPARGEWIEIIEKPTTEPAVLVSPRTGRVD